MIEKVVINNFKCFKGRFEIIFKEGMNIIVGNNGAGKTTILEAINLALTGLFNGKYIKNEISQSLFNIDVIEEFLLKINSPEPPELPRISIEIFFKRGSYPILSGNNNSDRSNSEGIIFLIEFDEDYKEEYSTMQSSNKIDAIPIEYYQAKWQSFARETISPLRIPVKPAFIDSSATKFQNGSDVYISRIIHDTLSTKDLVDISKAHRKLRNEFMQDDEIQKINKKISDKSYTDNRSIKLSVELLSRNVWESSLVAYLDNIPFHSIGQGIQCMIKTKLALSHDNVSNSSIILMEEPENHLTHSNLNRLLFDIEKKCCGKQIIISTHSSFVANKSGLNNLILLNNGITTSFDLLSQDTKEFFEKIAGYDTLRLVLSKKSVLVEGPSDELIFQRAYLDKYGKLPIEDSIDVISVGTSFIRFLEIAELIDIPVITITDNDGDIEGLKNKYSKYLGNNHNKICIIYSQILQPGNIPKFNYNTLEPNIIAVNDELSLKEIFKTTKSGDDLYKYMYNNKTDCALKIFGSDKIIVMPQYINEALNAIDDSDEK